MYCVVTITRNKINGNNYTKDRKRAKYCTIVIFLPYT